MNKICEHVNLETGETVYTKSMWETPASWDNIKSTRLDGEVVQYTHQGHLHREDGPALVVNRKGEHYTGYYCYGSLHRVDGPAWTVGGAKDRYFIHGKLQDNE